LHLDKRYDGSYLHQWASSCSLIMQFCDDSWFLNATFKYQIIYLLGKYTFFAFVTRHRWRTPGSDYFTTLYQLQKIMNWEGGDHSLRHFPPGEWSDPPLRPTVFGWDSNPPTGKQTC
jgi:hypothetical protein